MEVKMNVRFACSDAAFPLLPHDKVLQLIALLGFEGVDIGLFEKRSSLQPSEVFLDTKRHGNGLREKAVQNGLRIADVFYQAAPDFTARAINHPDSDIRIQERDNFLKILDYANSAGSYHVTCLPGVHYRQETYDSSLRRASDELSWRTEQAKQAGLFFGIEAHIGSLVPNPSQVLRLLEMTDGLKLTLDYTHFMRQGIANEEVHPLIPYASHFHARGAAPGRLQTIMDENEIDYPTIAKKMMETGYQGFFGIEYVWTKWEDCIRTDNVSESIMLLELIRKL